MIILILFVSIVFECMKWVSDQTDRGQVTGCTKKQILDHNWVGRSPPAARRAQGKAADSITIMEASDWSKNIIADLAYLSNSKTNSRDGGQVES